MSKLQVGDDDHPEAAAKNLQDAETLLRAGRHDGAAYLGGYVIESSLKTLILHDRAYDATRGAHDAGRLKKAHAQVASKSFGHALMKLMNASMGHHGAAYAPTPENLSKHTATWSESWRYRAPGVAQGVAADILADANRVYRQVVVKMRQDGIL